MKNTIVKLYMWAENIWFRFPQKIRYLLVGGFNTVFAYSVLAILLWAFGQLNEQMKLFYSDAVVANISLFVQYIISVNVSFMTMRYYVFQSKGDWVKEYVKAWSVYVFLYLINAPIMTFLIVILNFHPLVAQAIYLTFSTIVTYVLHKYYSFRKHSER